MVTEHFAVTWEAGDQARAEDVADALEYSWQREFVELGWREPAGMDQHRIRVTLEDNNAEGAFTTESDCGGVQVAHINIGGGVFNYEDWYLSVAAHELHHASQYRYGRAFDNWWWEATSVWMEEQVYPDQNEWVYYAQFYTAHPEWGYGTTSYSGDRSRAMYGFALFPLWLTDQQGGPEFMRQMWETSATLPANSSAELDQVLSPLGVDANDAYMQFLLDLALGTLTDADLFDGPAADQIDALPYSGRTPRDAGLEDKGYALMRLNNDALPADGVDIALQLDDRAQWFAIIGGYDADGQPVRLAPTRLGKVSEATLQLPPDHGLTSAVVVISAEGPLDGAQAFWDLSATPSVDTGGDTEPERTGCGCQSSPTWPSALVSLPLLALLRRRPSRVAR